MSVRGQRGLILPAVALLLVVGAIGLGISLYHRAEGTEVLAQSRTAQSLAEAKALLRRYAQSYHHSHPGNPVPGYLPCPDQDGDGSAELSCDGTSELSVGLLPYKTLGIPPLRDGSGECLWYAVAGTYKNSPHATGMAMNWDTPGQFAVVTPEGQSDFVINRPLDRASAVVIAPGPALPTQTRPARANNPCVASGGTGTQLASYLESTFTPANAAQLSVLTAPARTPTINDQSTWLRPGDIFDSALLRRGDFRNDIISDLINYVTLNLSAPPTTMLPPPDSAVRIGKVEVGSIPLALMPAPSSREGLILNDWQGQFVYLRCIEDPTSTCMMTATGSVCRGIVLFAGQSTAQQDRSSGMAVDFFESNTAALLAPEGAAFDGTNGFDPAQPHKDLVVCL